MESNEKFKLTTRRYLAWVLGGLAIGTLSFVVIWSLLFGAGCKELASTALGGLIFALGSIMTYYFKKLSEE